jgi:2-oxoglutarate dehydrogenase E2 component (dihydrolipoamide succinyltransferase)
MDLNLKLSPAARKMASEHDIDPAAIPAAGAGRIGKSDVVEHLRRGTSAAPVLPPEFAASEGTQLLPSMASPVPSAAADQLPARKEQRVPMTRLRKRAAERLLAAQRENAILTTFNEINMQPVMSLRERHREAFEKSHGVKLGFMGFFAKAAVEALKKFPVVNASVDGDDILYHNYYDIGVAVSAPRGLVVPIVRDVDQLSVAEVEKAIRDLGDKARNNALSIEELSGGTFTITNGGVFGSMMSTPILNPPQSAILGMHKTTDRPVAENGQVVIRPMMYVALSYDHRIIDGREAVQFLVHVKELIEDPARMLLQI